MSTHARSQLLDKEVDILQTGQWWIVELDDPKIAAQGESEQEALDKLAKRLEQYQGRRSRDSEWSDHTNNQTIQTQDMDQLAATR